MQAPPNPFLYLLQVSLGLLLMPVGPTVNSSTLELLLPIFGSTTVDQNSKALHDISFVVPSEATLSTPETESAPLLTSYGHTKNTRCSRSPASGRGSGATMQANPFLYLLQVRKRYEKAHRSNNVCLLLLPCPRPLIEVASSMHALFRTLLLLSGDETNPGLDDVSIAEELKAIAKDIQDIKKGRTETNQKLDAIDKKLERIGILEKQVTESNKKNS